jgi:hypothetical protein
MFSSRVERIWQPQARLGSNTALRSPISIVFHFFGLIVLLKGNQVIEGRGPPFHYILYFYPQLLHFQN